MVSSGQIPAGVSELTGKVVMQRTIGRPRQSQVEEVKKPRSPNSGDTDGNGDDNEEALGVRDILNFYRSNNEDEEAHDDLDREIESRILESRERNAIHPSEKNIEGPDDSVLSQTSDPLMALEDNIVTAAL